MSILAFLIIIIITAIITTTIITIIVIIIIIIRSLAHTVLVPSHDLADPGHRISRHKLDLATRKVIILL